MAGATEVESWLAIVRAPQRGLAVADSDLTLVPNMLSARCAPGLIGLVGQTVTRPWEVPTGGPSTPGVSTAVSAMQTRRHDNAARRRDPLCPADRSEGSDGRAARRAGKNPFGPEVVAERRESEERMLYDLSRREAVTSPLFRSGALAWRPLRPCYGLKRGGPTQLNDCGVGLS